MKRLFERLKEVSLVTASSLGFNVRLVLAGSYYYADRRIGYSYIDNGLEMVESISSSQLNIMCLTNLYQISRQYCSFRSWMAKSIHAS